MLANATPVTWNPEADELGLVAILNPGSVASILKYILLTSAPVAKSMTLGKLHVAAVQVNRMEADIVKPPFVFVFLLLNVRAPASKNCDFVESKIQLC